MSIAFRITLIIVSVFTLLYMCKKVKQEKLQIEYSIFWTLFAIMLVLFSIFPQIADWMSELVGVYSTTNFIFLLIIFILLVKCFQLTMDISKLDNKVKELVQKIAIDEKEKKGTEINEGNNSKEEIYVEYGWKSLQFTFLYASVDYR